MATSRGDGPEGCCGGCLAMIIVIISFILASTLAMAGENPLLFLVGLLVFPVLLFFLFGGMTFLEAVLFIIGLPVLFFLWIFNAFDRK